MPSSLSQLAQFLTFFLFCFETPTLIGRVDAQVTFCLFCLAFVFVFVFCVFEVLFLSFIILCLCLSGVRCLFVCVVALMLFKIVNLMENMKQKLRNYTRLCDLNKLY